MNISFPTFVFLFFAGAAVFYFLFGETGVLVLQALFTWLWTATVLVITLGVAYFLFFL